MLNAELKDDLGGDDRQDCKTDDGKYVGLSDQNDFLNSFSNLAAKGTHGPHLMCLIKN